MLLHLLTTALAFDICPDPPRPHITDLAVTCEQDELSLVARVEDDGAQVVSVELQLWSPSGSLLATLPFALDAHKTDFSQFSTPDAPLDCSERWLLRVVATNTLGQTGQRDRWLNSPVAVQNGGFEEDLWSWGVGGNAEVTWLQYVTDPLEPWQGNAMLMLGWPENAKSVYGYAWQNLGELPAGRYEVDFKYAIATDPDNTGDGCSALPEFFFGFNAYTDDEAFENYESDGWTLDEKCDELSPSDDGWWMVSDWESASVDFYVSSWESEQDTYLWFNSFGGLAYRSHWVYIDEVYITPPATETGHLAASVLTEPTYIGDPLSYPVEEPDYPTWFYWDHFEDQVNGVYMDLCGSACAAMKGKYGPEKTSPDDDVDGVWGFDGSMLHMPDDSVLLIETKTTAGLCFEDSDEGQRRAEEYIEKRRVASEAPLKKCDYEDCAQMSALWIEGTIRDLCAEEDDQRQLAAKRIEEAWDDGMLYTTWAAVGFEPPGGDDDECLTGWMLEAQPAPPKTRDEAICPDELE